MKKVVLIMSAVLLVAVVLLGMICMRSDKVDIDFAKIAVVYFQYKDTDAINQLRDNEMASVKTIFNGKKLYNDNPSCGFDENISIKFNGGDQIFCLAHDGCPIIY